MPIEFNCTNCARQLRVGDQFAGKQARCPQCSTVMQVPHAAALAPMIEPEFSPLGENQPYAGPGFDNVNLGQPGTPGAGGFNPNPYASPTVSSPYMGAIMSDNARLASRWARLGGALLDGIFTIMAMMGGIVLASMEPLGAQNVFEHDDITTGWLVAYGGALAYVVANWFLIVQSGQSVGKKIVGIRIVKLDGTLPGFMNGVFLRSIVPSIIGNIPIVGALFSLIDILFIFGEERRCVHDHMASTRVIEA